MNLFENVELVPTDPIYGLMETFKNDSRKTKINLGIGIFKDASLQTPRLLCVVEAERRLLEKEKDKIYLPIDGDQHYCDLGGRLVFGDVFWESSNDRFASIQTIGGTGALRFGGEFLKRQAIDTIYISDPTWANHKKIFIDAGFTFVNYPYYDKEKKTLTFDAMMQVLKSEKKKVAILFHAVCHNPTGVDLTLNQWEEIATLCEERGFIPFFDLAYLGFAEGLKEDAQSVRLFAKRGLEFFLALSFSKNFSLYGERVGALYYFSRKPEISRKVQSQLKVIVRGTYSSPPIHGAAVVREVLNDPKLRKMWENELTSMRLRIKGMKKALNVALSKRMPSEDFGFLEKGNGMFSITGLTKVEIDTIRSEYGIYMTQDGRINIAGLIEENLERVADAICKGDTE